MEIAVHTVTEKTDF